MLSQVSKIVLSSGLKRTAPCALGMDFSTKPSKEIATPTYTYASPGSSIADPLYIQTSMSDPVFYDPAPARAAAAVTANGMKLPAGTKSEVNPSFLLSLSDPIYFPSDSKSSQ
eukprot:gene5377-5597_t